MTELPPQKRHQFPERNAPPISRVLNYYDTPIKSYQNPYSLNAERTQNVTTELLKQVPSSKEENSQVKDLVGALTKLQDENQHKVISDSKDEPQKTFVGGRLGPLTGHRLSFDPQKNKSFLSASNDFVSNSSASTVLIYHSQYLLQYDYFTRMMNPRFSRLLLKI